MTPLLTCKVCGKKAPATRENFAAYRRVGEEIWRYRHRCRACYNAAESAKVRRFVADHPDVLAARRRAKRKNTDVRNREVAVCIRWQKKNYERNREINRAASKRYREKKAVDPQHRLNQRLRAGIRISLIKRGGEKAGRKWEVLVGYTAERLALHLERQFTKGMGWGNMGQWHIDHILPLSLFTFESPDDPGFKAAWALTNLRPLWAPRNIAKGATRETIL